MCGQEGDAQRFVTVGQRRLELRGSTEPCGNAGHHRIGDAGFAQHFDLLATAAEDEGIAALQPHRALSGFRCINQQFVDRILADTGLADPAADRNARGVAPDAIENFRRDQFVVENDIRILQRAQRLDGEQIGIARSGADQRHPALGLAVLARAGEGGGIGDFVQRFFGLVLAACEHQRADRAVDHALPEAAAQRKFGNAGMHRFAKAADEGGEIADARRQHRFDALAHAARDHRRSAAGADGNDDVAAIDDRGKDESGMREIVHHIDGQPDRLCARRHRNADVAGAGAEDCDHAGQIGSERIAGRAFDPGGISRIEPRNVMTAVSCIPANVGSSRCQEAQLRAHEFAGSDEQHHAALQIEKHGQESHAKLASPTSGLTGIIFYICVVQRSQRENYFFSIASQL